MKQLVQWHWH